MTRDVPTERAVPGRCPSDKQAAVALRHVIVLNPAGAVRGARDQVIEGQTLGMGIDQVHALLTTLDNPIADPHAKAQKAKRD